MTPPDDNVHQTQCYVLDKLPHAADWLINETQEVNPISETNFVRKIGIHVLLYKSWIWAVHYLLAEVV